MSGSPGKRGHGHIHIVAAVLADLENRGNREARTGVGVVFHHNVRLYCLDSGHDLAKGDRASYACHVLEADFVSACIDELLGEVDVVLDSMDRGVGDAQGGLGNHSGLLGVAYGRNHVARIVKSAENTGNIRSLSFLDLVEKLAQILRARAHTQAVQGPVQHMGLNARLVERLGPFPYGNIWVLSVEEIYLFEAAAVGLNAVEASHFDDNRCNAHQLVHARLVFAGALPHVPEDKAEFDFPSHYQLILVILTI